MILEKGKIENIAYIVELSKLAFDSDVNLFLSEAGGPPEYDSISWHEELINNGFLFEAIEDGIIIGAAIIFPNESYDDLYVGRIFINPVHYKKGYGIKLMELIEAYYPRVKKINLDTLILNIRTNSFYRKLGYYEVKKDDEFIYYEKTL